MRVQSIGDYYTLHGAAEALGVSYWRVWRAVHHQQTPTLLVGQTLLVLLEDVEQAIAGRESEASEPLPEPAPQAAGRSPQEVTTYRVRGQTCPECGSPALVYQSGCQMCYACGYAVC